MSTETNGETPPVESRLEQIAAGLKAGENVEPVTVRNLLRWFDAKRRGRNVVPWVQQTLYKHDLRTEPDFRYAYLDGPVELKLGKSQRDRGLSLDDLADLPGDDVEDTPPSAEIIAFPAGANTSEPRPVTRDPTYRIGKLTSANTEPTSVKPNDSLAIAITIMLAQNFSQLPVMNGREVKGVISWESIGTRLALGKKCIEVRECMDDPIIISEDTSLLDAIDHIVKYQYVLVQDSTKRISGIVTSSDLSVTFRELAEPFFLIDEIENHIRSLITRSGFTTDQLAAAAAENRRREVKTVFDLTIGDYIRLLQNPESWSQLKLAIDRTLFLGKLDEVRQIRNDVMHFNPDPGGAVDPEPLRKLAALLRKLRRAGVPEARGS